jgi:hypothetical protein
MKQITILSHNKKNLIADITHRLSAGGVNIDSITARDFGEQAIATLTTEDDGKALTILQTCTDLQAICEDALIVRIEDEVGSLARLARLFMDAQIDLRSIRFVERHNGYALVAISVERTEEALELVKNILVN